MKINDLGHWFLERAGTDGVARWTASAKWAEDPALDGQRDMPLVLRLSEGLGRIVCLLRT